MKKKVSSKQVAANRQNSQFSTGPRTREGKNKVLLNGLKHGLLSREVVLPSLEDQAEYDRLLEDLAAEYQPVCDAEEMLIDRIASCYWRLRRVVRYETAALRLQLNAAREDETQRLMLLLDRAREMLDENGITDMLLKSSRGIHFLINRLENTENELEHQGFLSKATHNSSVLNIGVGDQSLYGFYSRYYCIVHSYKAPPFGTTKDPEVVTLIDEARQQLLTAIKDERRRLGSLLESVVASEELEIERNIAVFCMPDKELADRIIRYEASMERQLYRAFTALELMRRQRREK